MTLNRNEAPPINQIEKISLPPHTNLNFKNGINGVVLHAESSELIELQFIFSAGSKYEIQPLQARICASMMKEGTSTLSQKQINEQIEYYGAHLEINSTVDFTVVKLMCLNRFVPELLPLLKSILTESNFPQKDFDTLIANRKQHLQLQKQKVEHLGWEQFNHLIFGKNYAAGSIITKIDFDRLHTEVLNSFYQQHIHAGNCRLLISGKADDEIIALIEKYFGGNDWSKPATIYQRPVIKSLTETTSFTEKKDAVQSAIRIGQLSVNKLSEDWTKMKVLDTVLGGYFGSRLMNNLREDKGYCYGVHSSMISMQDTGYFVITTEVGSDVTKQSVSEIFNELHRLQNEKVSEEELQLVKNYMLGSILSAVDGVMNASHAVFGLMTYDLPLQSFNNTVERINSVTADDVLLMAQNKLNIEAMKQAVAGSINPF